jgi:hypothetical protein
VSILVCVWVRENVNVWLSELTGEYISVCLSQRKDDCVVELANR